MALLIFKRTERVEEEKDGCIVDSNKEKKEIKISFKEGKTLSDIFSQAGLKVIKWLHLESGDSVGLKYIPKDGDVIIEFVPYAF